MLIVYASTKPTATADDAAGAFAHVKNSKLPRSVSQVHPTSHEMGLAFRAAGTRPAAQHDIHHHCASWCVPLPSSLYVTTTRRDTPSSTTAASRAQAQHITYMYDTQLRQPQRAVSAARRVFPFPIRVRRRNPVRRSTQNIEPTVTTTSHTPHAKHVHKTHAQTFSCTPPAAAATALPVPNSAWSSTSTSRRRAHANDSKRHKRARGCRKLWRHNPVRRQCYIRCADARDIADARHTLVYNRAYI